MNTPETFWLFPALLWCAGLLLLALALWPCTARLFAGLPDRGASLALPGGVFVYLLAAQLLWRTRLLTLHPAWMGLLVLALGTLGWTRFPPAPLLPDRKALRPALLVFTLAFFFWAGVRAAAPGIHHTEQPMNLMWMRAAMTAHTPPIPDAWFGGAPATYYAEGHQMLAFLAHLFGTPAGLAYNLGQVTLFALTCTLAYAAGTHLLPDDPRPARTGILAVSLLFISNPAGALHALGRDLPHAWWWNSTRILRDGDTELITEFPFFSFWLGDNHAHLIGLPVLLLSFIAALQLYQKRPAGFADGFFTALPAGLALIWSLCVNPWQAPTALALPLLALLLHPSRTPPNRAVLAGLLTPLLLISPLTESTPFQGIALNTFGLRPPLDLLKHFGFFLPGLLLRPRKHPLLFAILLLALAMLLTPEIVYARDAFGTRMNTVFKVYYQVWLLLALLAAAGLTHLTRHSSLVIRHSSFVTRHSSLVTRHSSLVTRHSSFVIRHSSLVILLGLLYPLRLALPAWNRAPRTLHAAAVLPADQRELIDIADRLIQPGDRILEAPGTAYDPHTSLLGTWTAGHTLLGWTGHQAQWRPGAPHPDILPLFSADPGTLLNTHNIRWILIGPAERALTTPEWRRRIESQSHTPVQNATYQLHQLRRLEDTLPAEARVEDSIADIL
ncbi:MAG: hypothetical protein JJU05_00625 [Verrucomicrobia bacterium]|nr:hypothetical protein [Verrucomicrobiota bacterium]MCH8526331.1 DUF2298 domain-containing protein [Kiritimatiellia bacterium]